MRLLSTNAGPMAFVARRSTYGICRADTSLSPRTAFRDVDRYVNQREPPTPFEPAHTTKPMR